MFKVDKEKCIKCGKCAFVCPFTCISMDNEYPEMIARKEKGCMKCLHCSLICPVEALEFEGMPCTTGAENGQMEGADEHYETLKKIILRKRSKRRFNNTLVPEIEIEEIIRISDFAPSSKNQHPQHWVVVHRQETMEKIMALVVEWVNEKQQSLEILSELKNGNNVVTLGAPHLILGCGPKEGKINPYTDTIIGLTDIDLLLHAKGLGTCWAGYLTRIINTSKEIRTLLDIGDDLQVFGILAFGYTEKEDYLRWPYREKTQISWK